MWSFISRLVLRLAAIRWLFKLGGLGLLIPIAFILKTIGLPVLLVLIVLALPVLALLFLFGLPVFLVLAFGGLFMGLVGAVLAIGIAALKFAIFVVLPIWLMWKLMRKIFRGIRRRGGRRWGCDGDEGGEGGEGKGGGTPSSDVPPPATGAGAADIPIDPLVDPLD